MKSDKTAFSHKGVAMKHNFNNIFMYLSRMNRQHFQVILLLLSLILLVIGAGAPIGGGDGGL